MKRFFLLALLAIIAVVSIRTGVFYYKNLRGARPAFLPSPQDITEMFPGNTPTSEPETREEVVQSGPAVNKTDFPLVLPNGFSVSIFAASLGKPRVMTRDRSGHLVVSIPSSGRVVALPDADKDGRADRTQIVIDRLNSPHGLAFHPNTNELYVAEMHRVVAYEYDDTSMTVANPRKIVDLPSGGNHTTRTIGFGPDGKLYIAVGSTCNVCVEKDWRRTKILVADPDGGNIREFASGLRNAVFFTWRPKTNDLWATEMGRDFLGDNLPPDEVNIVREGSSYGWPYCWGNRMHDDDFDRAGKMKDFCQTTEAPHIALQAHSAPLGLAFIPDSWPKEYRGDLLVSYHGSWNRSEPTGYKVVRFDLDDEGNSRGESDFLSGWLTEGGALGRPVDLLFDDSGTLFLSDDKAGVIYRVTPP
jgi:glucose/arabinose dehydrogenase